MGRHKSWRTFGAQKTSQGITPPLRTGLLSASPSDLRVILELQAIKRPLDKPRVRRKMFPQE